MNGTYFVNPTFLTLENDDELINTSDEIISKDKKDYSNFDRNLKKKVKVFASFPYLSENKGHFFDGILEYFSNDHIIVRDIQNDVWYYVLTCYINYIEFQEKID